jgi:hypothetical protein
MDERRHDTTAKTVLCAAGRLRAAGRQLARAAAPHDARLGLRLVRSAFRKRQSWLDRLLTRLLRRATAPSDASADFMRDEIVDAGIGFDPEELLRYQQTPPHE